jgi:hypothetical protein
MIQVGDSKTKKVLVGKADIHSNDASNLVRKYDSQYIYSGSKDIFDMVYPEINQFRWLYHFDKAGARTDVNKAWEQFPYRNGGDTENSSHGGKFEVITSIANISTEKDYLTYNNFDYNSNMETGINGYLSLNNTQYFQIAEQYFEYFTRDFSIDFWINFSQINTTYPFYYIGGSTSSLIKLGTNNSNQIVMTINGTSTYTLTGPVVSLNAFHHIFINYDSTNKVFYLGFDGSIYSISCPTYIGPTDINHSYHLFNCRDSGWASSSYSFKLVEYAGRAHLHLPWTGSNYQVPTRPYIPWNPTYGKTFMANPWDAPEHFDFLFYGGDTTPTSGTGSHLANYSACATAAGTSPDNGIILIINTDNLPSYGISTAWPTQNLQSNCNIYGGTNSNINPDWINSMKCNMPTFRMQTSSGTNRLIVPGVVTDNCTIDFYMKPNIANTAGVSDIFYVWNGFRLYFSGTVIYTESLITSTGKAGFYWSNRWYHVAFTVSGTTVKTYIDGWLFTTYTINPSTLYDGGCKWGNYTDSTNYLVDFAQLAIRPRIVWSDDGFDSRHTISYIPSNPNT